MIAKKKEFYGGFVMLAGFFIVLAIMFMPVIDGHNAMEYSDSLYNSISKGSAYYIPKIKKETEVFSGTVVNMTLPMVDGITAEQTGLLFMKGGGLVNVNKDRLKVSGIWQRSWQTALPMPMPCILIRGRLFQTNMDMMNAGSCTTGTGL